MAAKSTVGPVSRKFVKPAEIASLSAVFKRTNKVIDSLVAGNSMGDTLPDGARIRIRCGRFPIPGEVVAFLAGDKIVSHRFAHFGKYRRARAFLITGGDNSLVCDPPVHKDLVLGVVSHVRLDDEWVPVVPSPKTPLFKTIVRTAVATSLELSVYAALATHAVFFMAHKVVMQLLVLNWKRDRR